MKEKSDSITAIEFADWIADNFYVKATDGNWLKMHPHKPIETQKCSTAKLYQIFIRQK